MEVTPAYSTLEITYVFASEEYPEYPNFDDAFGIFIEGGDFDPEQNQAILPGTNTTLSVTQLLSPTHQAQMIDNSNSTKASFTNWQYDGFTPALTRSFSVTPGQSYTLKFVILDRLDAIYDTGVFVGFRSK